MTHWNYRIVDMSTANEPHFAIQEVYWDGDKLRAYADAAPVGESKQGVIENLELMLREARSQEIIPQSAFHKKEGKTDGRR